MTLDSLLKVMVQKGASDLYLLLGNPPIYRLESETTSFDPICLTVDTMRSFLDSLLNPTQLEKFNKEKELNLSYCLTNQERFRCNVYLQKGGVAMVFRHVLAKIPSREDLGLPQTLYNMVMQKTGLVLVTGPTGSGKSTTMASMIDYRIQKGWGHVVTIEDPIEYYFQSKQTIISQRELDIDTHSYGAAMKSALRQAPDVLLVGELRDRESVEMAINFSETGHLVISTLHSTNATQSIQRLLQFFDDDEIEMVCLRLSMNLKGIISQRLLPKKDARGQVLAMELLYPTPRIQALIRKQEFVDLKKAMRDVAADKMVTLDKDLWRLYDKGLITEEIALSHADSANNLRLRIKGFQAGSITTE